MRQASPHVRPECCISVQVKSAFAWLAWVQYVVSEVAGKVPCTVRPTTCWPSSIFCLTGFQILPPDVSSLRGP